MKRMTLVCCNPAEYVPLVTAENNPTITKAMRYSQYIKNRKNTSTVITTQTSQ
jgi:hypothetical protein